MIGLDPLSSPVAITEMLLLLALAAFVGWLLGRLVLNGRISALRADVADRKAELDDCRQSKTGIVPVENVPSMETYADPPAEPAIEMPATYVSAEPLLPAFSHDDTPNPMAADELLANELAVEEIPVAPVVADVPTAGNSEAAVLNRIAARSGEVNFDRIGRATAAEADDLKDIIGIGPFLERKLHSLGIYTFRQVANFTKEDMDKVNGIIEFFPGRIERDNWVDQAQAFHERKYGRTDQKTHE